MRRRALRQRSQTPFQSGSQLPCPEFSQQPVDLAASASAPKRHFESSEQQQQPQPQPQYEQQCHEQQRFEPLGGVYQPHRLFPLPGAHREVPAQVELHPHAHWQHDPRQRYRRAPRPVLTRAVLPSAPSVHEHQQPEAAAPPHSSTATSSGDQWASSWLCVRQERPGGQAHVYLHTGPLSEQAWRGMPHSDRPELLMTIQERQCSFTGCSHVDGAWHCFHLRYNDAPPVYAESIMHPNQVQLLVPASPGQTQQHRHHQPPESGQQLGVCRSSLHHLQQGQEQGLQQLVVSRTKHHYCSLEDVVEWLSDPSPERMRTHLANMLRALRQQRQQSALTDLLGDDASPGMQEQQLDQRELDEHIEGQQSTPEHLYHRLCHCYGREALTRAGLTRAAVLALVTQRAAELMELCKPRARPLAAVLHYRLNVEADLRSHQSLDSLDDPHSWLHLHRTDSSSSRGGSGNTWQHAQQQLAQAAYPTPHLGPTGAGAPLLVRAARSSPEPPPAALQAWATAWVAPTSRLGAVGSALAGVRLPPSGPYPYTSPAPQQQRPLPAQLPLAPPRGRRRRASSMVVAPAMLLRKAAAGAGGRASAGTLR